MSQKKRNWIWITVSILCVLFLGFLSKMIDTDWGKIDVSYLKIMTQEQKVMAAKLYRPKFADEKNPLPGILALHGYQSDKEAPSTFGMLELAKRGFVVLSIDQLGHGYSQGEVNDKTKSGANNGYIYLKTLSFVDKENIGIFGHSTGGMNSIALGNWNPDHKAIVGLSSSGGNPGLHNYMMVQGLYEEIGGYREKTWPVKDLVTHPKRLEAFGFPGNGRIEWNTTYGDFSDGSARRIELVKGTHLGVMVNRKANAAVCEWFHKALQKSDNPYFFDSSKQTYYIKEVLGFIMLLITLSLLFPLTDILLASSFFASITRPKQVSAYSQKMSFWWIAAFINIALTVFCYPFFAKHGGPGTKTILRFPFARMEMTNGITNWMFFSALISIAMYVLWLFLNKKNKEKTLACRMEYACSESTVFCIRDIAKNILAALILVGAMYVLTIICGFFFNTELRCLWPFMKAFDVRRIGYVFVYFVPVFMFFFVNNGIFLFGQNKLKEYQSEKKTILLWWLFNVIASVGGLMLLWLIHFVPDYMQIGPGLDVLGLGAYAGRWMMMLNVMIPQFIIINLVLILLYRKTRRIYLGSFVGTLLILWFQAAGQVIGRF